MHCWHCGGGSLPDRIKSMKSNKTLKTFLLGSAIALGIVAFGGTTTMAQYRDRDRDRNDDRYSNRDYNNNDRYRDRDRDDDDRYNGRDRRGNQSLRFAYQRGYQQGLKDGRRDGRRNRNIGYGNYGNNGNYGGYNNGNRNGWGNNGQWQRAYQDGYRNGYRDGLNRSRGRNNRGIWPF